MLARQSIIYLVLSFIVVLGAKYIQLGTHFIADGYGSINLKLVPYLANDAVRHVLLMILLPIVIAGIPALIFRLIKKQNMPYYLTCTWVVWIILVLSNALGQ